MLADLYERWLSLPLWGRVLTAILAPVLLVGWGIYLGASNAKTVVVKRRDYARDVEVEVERVEDQVDRDQDDPNIWRLE